jgi:hypothetical protein
VVIEMKKIVPHKKVSLAGRLLRFLGRNRSLEVPSNYQEDTHVPIPTGNHYINQKEIRVALLEAELRKAEALTEWRRRHTIC